MPTEFMYEAPAMPIVLAIKPPDDAMEPPKPPESPPTSAPPAIYPKVLPEL